MIHVLATIQLAPGRQAEFLAEFQKLVPLVRTEPGCIEYGPAIDAAAPIGAVSAIRKDVITVVEKWESIEALIDHLATPHIISYREAVKEIVTSVEIRVLTPV